MLLALCSFLGLAILWCLGYFGILQIENTLLGGVYFELETLYFYSGWCAFGLLLAGMVSPKPYGKILGLLAFVALCWHVFIFIHLDFNFDFQMALQKVFNEKALMVGLFGFIGFVVIFVVSLLNYFRRFYMQFIVYLAILLGLLHVLMLQKVLDIFYMTFLVVVIMLLGFKILRLGIQKLKR